MGPIINNKIFFYGPIINSKIKNEKKDSENERKRDERTTENAFPHPIFFSFFPVKKETEF